jgi:hypothetical protein
MTQAFNLATVGSNTPSFGGAPAVAWVNFDGTLSGPITPRASFNVTNITKTATGVYVINFTNALASANYALTAVGNNASSGIYFVSLNGTPTTTTCPIQAYSTTVNVNLSYIMCVIHGG